MSAPHNPVSARAYGLACPACGAVVPFDDVEWDGSEGAPADFGRCPECGTTSDADEWVEAEDTP